MPSTSKILTSPYSIPPPFSPKWPRENEGSGSRIYTIKQAVLVRGAEADAQKLAGKRFLKVERIDPKDYSQAAKTARAWETIAREKEKKSPSRFSDCAMLCSLIADYLRYAYSDEAYVCKDSEGREQGMMLIDIEKTIFTLDPQFRGKYVKIGYLVTHPRNIRCPENEKDPERVEGVGSALVDFAQRRAEELHSDGVFLDGIPSAKPFYLKAGFKEIPTYSFEGSYTMFKTVEKISERITPEFVAAAAA